jgi:hypothetical protein
MKRRELSPAEVAERESDPSGLTRYFYRHPWRAGVASGALLVAWLSLAGRIAGPIAIAVGVAVMLVMGLLWRPGGPGQRWRRYMLQRFPEKNRRDS